MSVQYDNDFFDDMSTRQPPSVTKTYMSEEEEELEYTAAPFYVHDEETGDFEEDEDGNPIYPAELDDQKHKIEKKFKQQRKMNWYACLVLLWATISCAHVRVPLPLGSLDARRASSEVEVVV